VITDDRCERVEFGRVELKQVALKKRSFLVNYAARRNEQRSGPARQYESARPRMHQCRCKFSRRSAQLVEVINDDPRLLGETSECGRKDVGEKSMIAPYGAAIP
jgi:hypothetical protein